MPLRTNCAERCKIRCHDYDQMRNICDAEGSLISPPRMCEGDPCPECGAWNVLRAQEDTKGKLLYCPECTWHCLLT